MFHKKYVSVALVLSSIASMASVLVGCGDAGGEQAVEADGMATSETTGVVRSAVSVEELQPQVESLNPLRIRLPAEHLVPALEREILATLQDERIDERGKRFSVDNVTIELGQGEVNVKVRGEGAVRNCQKPFGKWYCTPWLSSTVRGRVTVGLAVDNWVVRADHRYTDLSASNDLVDALIRGFHERIYGKVNDGIRKGLASVDGRNLRTELEGKLGMPLPPEAVVNVIVDPNGVVLEAR